MSPYRSAVAAQAGREPSLWESAARWLAHQRHLEKTRWRRIVVMKAFKADCHFCGNRVHWRTGWRITAIDKNELSVFDSKYACQRCSNRRAGSYTPTDRNWAKWDKRFGRGPSPARAMRIAAGVFG